MSNEPKVVQCARLRREFWRELASSIEDIEPERATRLRAMADGISYAVADHTHDTDPGDLRLNQASNLPTIF